MSQDARGRSPAIAVAGARSTRAPGDGSRSRGEPEQTLIGGRLNWEAGQRARSDRPGAQRDHTPVRTCIGCRQRAVAGDLLRMVAMDGCLVVLDERRRLPGRGAWLHHDTRCLAMAERRRAFPRALRVSGGLDLARVRHYFEQGSQSTTVAGAAAEPEEESRSTRHESAVKLKP